MTKELSIKIISPAKPSVKNDKRLFSDKLKYSSPQQTFLKGISKILTFGRRNMIAEKSEIQIMKEQSKPINMWVDLNKH